MKNFRLTYLLLMLVVISGGYQHVEGRNILKAYPPMKGKVVDGTTGKPLEGALIVAQWTKKHGFGLTYHELNLITETVTDKEGVFSITKTPNDPFVEPPRMIIYKEGHIPWRNDSTFPSSNTVKDYEWNNNVTYKLDEFTDKYTAEQLANFIDYGMTIGMGLRESKIFSDTANKLSKKRTDEIEKQKLKAKKP